MNRFAVTLDSVVIVSRQNQISDGDPKKRVCLKFVFVKNNEKNRGIKYLIDFYVQVCYTESRRKEITLTNSYH